MFGQRQQSACADESVGAAKIRVGKTAAEQRSPLSGQESRQQIVSSRRHADVGNGCWRQRSNRRVETRREDRVIVGAGKRFGHGLFQREGNSSSGGAVPTAKHATAHRLGSETPTHFVMATPVHRARRVPDAIQATRKVEPHLVRYSLSKIEACTSGALEGHPPICLVDERAKSSGNGQEQQRKRPGGATVGTVLVVSVFELELPRRRFALADPQHGLGGEGQRIIFEVSAIKEVRFECRRRNQRGCIPRIMRYEGRRALKQIPGDGDVGCQFIRCDGLNALLLGVDVVANEQSRRLLETVHLLIAGFQRLQHIVRWRGTDVQAVRSLKSLIAVAIAPEGHGQSWPARFPSRAPLR